MRRDDPIVAWVVNVDDPSQMGRVQIRINGIHDDVEDEHLPWAAPKIIPGYGSLDVPPKGHAIYVTLQDHGNGDPLYSGKPLVMNDASPMAVADIFRYDYPQRHGWWDSIGNYLYRNQKDGSIQFATASGVTTTSNSDGSVVVDITGVGKARHNKSDPDIKKPTGGNPRILFKIGEGAESTMELDPGKLTVIVPDLITFSVGGSTTLQLKPAGMVLTTPSGVQTWGL